MKRSKEPVQQLLTPRELTQEDPLTALFSNNPSICSHFFSLIHDVKDFKSIRLVSKRWRDLSLPKWRATAVPRLVPKRDVLKPHMYADLNRGSFDALIAPAVDFEQFLEVMGNTQAGFQEHPFVRYQIISYHVVHLDLDHQFWALCGAHMKSLNLSSFHNDNRALYPTLEKILSEKCPNLEELTVFKPPFFVDWIQLSINEETTEADPPEVKPAKYLKTFHVINNFCLYVHFTEDEARRLAILFSNIQTLSLDSVSHGFVQMLKYTGNALQPIMLSKLTMVDQETEPDGSYPQIEEYLDKVKPPLESLEWNGYHFEGSLYRTILGCQATLQKLTVNLSENSDPYDFSDSSLGSPLSLPHLVHLNLSGEITVTLTDLQQMPNLKVFHIEPAEMPGQLEVWLENTNNVALEHLEDMRLPHGLESEEWQALANGSPNLKILQIDWFSSDDISNFMKLLRNSHGKLIWSQLEELTVLQYPSEDDDPVITTFTSAMLYPS